MNTQAENPARWLAAGQARLGCKTEMQFANPLIRGLGRPSAEHRVTARQEKGARRFYLATSSTTKMSLRGQGALQEIETLVYRLPLFSRSRGVETALQHYLAAAWMSALTHLTYRHTQNTINCLPSAVLPCSTHKALPFPLICDIFHL